MKEIDFTALDGRMLKTFLVVLEEKSVSRAADRLGVTQSSVSHTLNSLRVILKDPLFLRSGRGILPTERARTLLEPVQSVFDGLKALTDDREFDPRLESMEFTIAANDFQRELLFPPLVREFDALGLDARFRFLPGGVPSVSLLQDAHCQLIVTPFPPKGADIMQTALFQDRVVCFFDADMRDAPRTKDEFIASDYVEVRFPDYSTALVVLTTIGPSKLKRPKVSVPNFGDLAAFLKGTSFITTQMSKMSLGPLAGFGIANLPFKNDPLTLYLAWHRRDHSDPAHKWLREKIKMTASVN